MNKVKEKFMDKRAHLEYISNRTQQVNTNFK